MEEQLPQQQQPSHWKDILILLAVPLAIALITAAIVYVPRALASPSHDFVYYRCDFVCEHYRVDDDGRTITDTERGPVSPRAGSSLHYYDVANDMSRELTLRDAQRYLVDAAEESPDGYTLVRERGDGGFLFWSDYRDDWYLSSGMKKQPVNLGSENRYNTNQVYFLGWVEQ